MVGVSVAPEMEKRAERADPATAACWAHCFISSLHPPYPLCIDDHSRTTHEQSEFMNWTKYGSQKILGCMLHTELTKKVCPRLRDSGCWRSGEITQPT